MESLLGRVDRLLIGGGMAFTFLRAQGHEVGRSLLEAELVPVAARLLDAAKRAGVEIRLPVDSVVAESPEAPAGQTVPLGGIPPDRMGLDIGPATVTAFTEALGDSRTIVWNGPMGVFEQEPFSRGTVDIAIAVADCAGLTVAGGGDSVAALRTAGVAHRIKHVSTGGGASLEFIEGKDLPGLRALS